MCHDHHQHSELFKDIDRIHVEKYHPYPLMICVIIDNILVFPRHKCVLVLDWILSSLLSSICSSLPWSITIFYVKYVVRISPPRMTSWYSDTSPHHHSFLVPVLFLKGIPTNGLWCVNSKLLATLLLWSYWSIVSFYAYGLMNHHSDIDCAT